MNYNSKIKSDVNSKLKIVLKSSFTNICGAKLYFAHSNPGSAHIDELNSLFDGIIRAKRGGGRRNSGIALYLRESYGVNICQNIQPYPNSKPVSSKNVFGDCLCNF
jgi:hypothetical protein